MEILDRILRIVRKGYGLSAKPEMTVNKMFGWHHQLDGHEFEQTLRIGNGQGSLACCSPRGPQRDRHD